MGISLGSVKLYEEVTMKCLPLLSSILAMSLTVSAPVVLAHVGHGDEFQAEGGVNRVEVHAQTDSLLGIQVTPIEPATDGSGAVMIPVSALVEDNDRQLVFVKYGSFYEPVDVATGDNKGELIEITEGLSVGEQLVDQGSLSLYAESRKTQTAAASSETNETTPNDASAQETATESGGEDSSDVTPGTNNESVGVPIGWVAAVGVVVATIVGAVVLGAKKKESV